MKKILGAIFSNWQGLPKSKNHSFGQTVRNFEIPRYLKSGVNKGSVTVLLYLSHEFCCNGEINVYAKFLASNLKRKSVLTKDRVTVLHNKYHSTANQCYSFDMNKVEKMDNVPFSLSIEMV